MLNDLYLLFDDIIMDYSVYKVSVMSIMLPQFFLSRFHTILTIFIAFEMSSNDSKQCELCMVVSKGNGPEKGFQDGAHIT